MSEFFGDGVSPAFVFLIFLLVLISNLERSGMAQLVDRRARDSVDVWRGMDLLRQALDHSLGKKAMCMYSESMQTSSHAVVLGAS